MIKKTYQIQTIGIVVMLLMLSSCQSIRSTFGNYNFNTHQEVMLGTLGHEEKSLFSPPQFISYSTVLTPEKLEITLKKDSIGLSTNKAISFYADTSKTKLLQKHKKEVYILSVINKQDLIELINENTNLNAFRDLKVVSEIVLKNTSLPPAILEAETTYIHFNDREKAYQILSYNNGKEQITNLNPNAIIGYRSLFLCCTMERTKVKVQNLSDSKCKGSTYKTQRLKSKTENYERF